jgi:hypothetical protein
MASAVGERWRTAVALTCPAVILILRSGTFSVGVFTSIRYTLNPIPSVVAPLIYHGRGNGVKWYRPKADT